MSPNDGIAAALHDHAAPVPSVTDGSDELPKKKGDEGVSSTLRFGSARIVGLGEATHGTKECFEYKRRLIRHLVEEAGFRTVAFEADTAGATALDAYVRGDGALVDAPGDAASAIAELDMWQWQTESVRELLTWLRAFNDGRPPDNQVRIHGVDLSSPAAPAEPLRAYFERVEPAVTETDAFRTVADAAVTEDEHERERTLDAVADAAGSLAERLDQSREAYAATTSSNAWRDARHLCRVVEQTCEWARVRHEQPGPHPEGMATRDRFMAENATWALAREPGDGVALWAHDGHVQRGTFDDGSIWADVPTMGDRLADELGDAYRPIGFDFARGTFRAVDAESSAVATFAVSDPPADTATATLESVERRPYVLDLRAAAADDRLASWLAEERRTRYVGSVFDLTDDDDAAFAETDLEASFDCLLVLSESTPSEPIGAGRSQNP